MASRAADDRRAGAGMLIRECASSDIEALERHLPTWDGTVHGGHLAQQVAGHWTYLVAWDDDGVPVGVCVIRWEGWAEQAGPAGSAGWPEASNLQVHEARRGRGVGTALLEAAEERARARGFNRLGIGVAEDNPGAARLYARLGYTDTGLRSESRYMFPDGAGVLREIVENDILLVKELGE